MSTIQKANDFVKLLTANGWTGKKEYDPEHDWVMVYAERGPEKLEIGWCDDVILGPPKYEFAGTVANLHSRKIAADHVKASKPDMTMYLLRQKRKARAARAMPVDGQPPVELTKHELPFDIHNSTDREILLAIRGSKIVWKNSFTGMPEEEFIPRERNRDLTNVFYVAESSKGRPYVSFMTDQGVFRAVALEQILQVR